MERGYITYYRRVRACGSGQWSRSGAVRCSDWWDCRELLVVGHVYPAICKSARLAALDLTQPRTSVSTIARDCRHRGSSAVAHVLGDVQGMESLGACRLARTAVEQNTP